MYSQAVSGSGSALRLRSKVLCNFRFRETDVVRKLALSLKYECPIFLETHSTPGIEQMDRYEAGPVTNQ